MPTYPMGPRQVGVLFASLLFALVSVEQYAGGRIVVGCLFHFVFVSLFVGAFVVAVANTVPGPPLSLKNKLWATGHMVLQFIRDYPRAGPFYVGIVFFLLIVPFLVLAERLFP